MIEQALVDLAHSQERLQIQLQTQIDQFVAESRQFVAESRQFVAESRQFAADSRQAAAESRATGARLDRQWGELANKMGTLTEDIVLPGIPTVFRTFFGDAGRVDLAVRGSWRPSCSIPAWWPPASGRA